jgi:hypothetical protein
MAVTFLTTRLFFNKNNAVKEYTDSQPIIKMVKAPKGRMEGGTRGKALSEKVKRLFASGIFAFSGFHQI